MNEEIDIIELLKRVKEGKAPKKIEVYGKEYEIRNTADIVYYYTRTSATGHTYNWLEENSINTITKIKILDKPIIEEFEVTDTVPLPHQFRDKINEIIKFLNNKE